MSNSWTLRKFDLAADSMAVLSEHTGPAAARRALADLVASECRKPGHFFSVTVPWDSPFTEWKLPHPRPEQCFGVAAFGPGEKRVTSAEWKRSERANLVTYYAAYDEGRARLAPDFASDKPFGDLVGVSVRDAWELHPLPHSDAEEEAAIEAAYRRLGAQDKSLVDRLGGPAACGMRVVYLMGWFEPLMGHPRAEYVRERMRRAVSELTA